MGTLRGIWLPTFWPSHSGTSAYSPNYFILKNSEEKYANQNAKKAPFSWYEELLTAIRPWISGETAAPIPIDLNRSEGEIKKILGILSENYLTISKEMSTAQLPVAIQADHPLGLYFPFYQLSGYAAKVRLRLMSDGKIVKEVKPNVETEILKTEETGSFPTGGTVAGKMERRPSSDLF